MQVLLLLQSAKKKTFSSSLTQSLLSLILIVGVIGEIFFFYNDLGRRIQTTSGGDTINYYYDPPKVELLELGHSVNGNRQWNLYGPDRSGFYGGAQGIGGLESCYTENTKTSFGIVNNYFGDVVGLVSSGTFTPYQNALGAYGAMPGSSVNQALQPQWRGHYIDNTGLYCMGARYYDPQGGRFISPDPLGHSSSLSLYDYCNGDPVNGLDPDGRCVEGGVKGYAMGTFAEYDNTAQAVGGFVGTLGSYVTPGLGEYALARDIAGSAWHGLQAAGDMYSNGVNWRNGTQLGLSAVGVGAGAFAALVPAKSAVEAIASAPIAVDSTMLSVSENPIIVVGEGMQRVNAFSQEMTEQGMKARTYPAININRPINPNVYGSPKSLNANRSWLDYWARGKKADVIDIGPQPGRSISSPYYDMEVQNLYLWEQSNKINPVIRFDPGY